MNSRVTPVRSYLEGTDSSANYTAEEVTTLARDISLGLNESLFSPEGFLWGLWAEVVEVIEEIPHNYAWQDRLVELLGAIKQVPRQVTPEMEELERDWRMAFWQDLPILGAEVRESWGQGPWEKMPDDVVFTDGGHTPFSPSEWASLNAFTARITAASVSNFEAYAIWILRHTLEEEGLSEEVVDDNLPAAAMWIIYAGQTIYHNAAKDYTSDSQETHPTHVRYLRTFTKPFSVERWTFWKQRFEFFRNLEGLEQFTRDCAGDAFSRMVEIERRYPEPKASEEPALQPCGMMTAFHVQILSGAE